MTSVSAVPYLSAAVPLRLASAGSAAAIPVLAFQELHDVAIGGGLVAASLAPSILAAPFAGALLDRSRHPRRLVVLSGVVTAGAFALTALLGVIPTAVIAIALVAAGAVTPFFMGGLSSFVTDAVPGSPERAFGADALAYNIGSVAGPALAAAAIAIGSARASTLVLAAAAAIGAVAAAAALRIHPHPVQPDRPRMLREILDGTRFLVTHRPIAAVTASGALSQVGQGALPIAAVGIALLTTHDAAAAAWIVTGFAVGALLGSVAVTAWPIRRVPAVVVMAGSFAVTGVLSLAAATGAALPVVIVLTALAGAATGPGVAAMLLLRTRHSPRARRSQVFTVGAGLRATGAAVGAGLAGLLPSAQAELLLALIGACWLASAVILAAYPRNAPAADAADRDPADS
jgi:MFS family permease